MLFDEEYSSIDLYKRFIIQFFVFLFAALLTSGVFMAIEKGAHEKSDNSTELINYDATTSNLLSNFSDKHNISIDELEDLIHMTDKLEQYDGYWIRGMTYQEAFVLTLSIFTTIGLEQVCPITGVGKFFTIIIAIIGIPLTIIMLTSSGQIISRHVLDLLLATKRFLQSRSKYFDPVTSRTKVSKYLFVPFLIGLILLFILVTSYFIELLEDFHYGDAVYYACMAIFTIGFGDYVLSEKFYHDHLGVRAGLTIFMFIWILFGLSLIMSLFIVIFTYEDQEKDKGNFHSYRKSVSQDIDLVQENEGRF